MPRKRNKEYLVPDFGKDQTTRFRRSHRSRGAAAVSAGSAGLTWSAELEEAVVLLVSALSHRKISR